MQFRDEQHSYVANLNVIGSSPQHSTDMLLNNNIYLLQLGCYPVAVVILHVNKHEIGYY